MTTDSPTNSFVKDGKLYILPTLTSDIIGRDAIFDGYTYNLTGCTNEDWKSCGAVSNSTTGIVINPVQSALLTTRKSHSIQFGKVEVRAKIPRGYERVRLAFPLGSLLIPEKRLDVARDLDASGGQRIWTLANKRVSYATPIQTRRLTGIR